jgi:SAM-dependent methyltransferase
MGRWSRRVGAIFIDWLAPKKGLSWVDVGCGNGAFTEELIRRCAPKAVTGIDPSAGQIAYARGRPGTRAARFEVADSQALPFDDGSFDAAAMALVITFVPDPPKAVAEMARAVRPGGLVATYMWDIPHGVPLTPLYSAVEALGFGSPQRRNPGASEIGTLRAMWTEAGLKDVETREIAITVNFDSLDDFWDSNFVTIGPQGKLFAALSPGDKAALRAKLQETLPIDGDGRIAYKAWANAVKGRVG